MNVGEEGPDLQITRRIEGELRDAMVTHADGASSYRKFTRSQDAPHPAEDVAHDALDPVGACGEDTNVNAPLRQNAKATIG